MAPQPAARTVDPAALFARGAGELASSIASRSVSAREVVDAHLARIEQVNPGLNAVVRVLADDAREAADAADRAVADGAPLGPLHGVPFTVKENVDVAGLPTTDGVKALADHVAIVDAPVVERLRAAGGILVGRTNMPDFGLRIHTDSSLHGLTRNPWNSAVTAGGSSGGEGSAIASGMTPLGVGNDIGGSLRNPAHACGIASIKPTSGVVPDARSTEPLDGGLTNQLMHVNGIMARRVADVRLGLSVVAGQHRRDPGSLPVDLAQIRADGPVRVALVPEPPGGDTDAGVAAVVRRSGDVLQAAGYEVEEVVPPRYEEAIEVWGRWLMADVRVMRPMLEPVMGADGLRFLDFVDPLYPQSTTQDLVMTFVLRRTIARLWASFFEDHPLIVSPVWTQPPFAHGFDIASADQAAATMRLLRPVMHANLLGLPAAVIPGGTEQGMPVGVQVMGDRFRDLQCLEAAEAVESAVGVLTPVDPV